MKADTEIEVVTLDADGYETDSRDFETVKAAREWVKTCGLRAEYWDRAAESPGFAARSVHTLQLRVDGDCRQDWFPNF